jgi:Spy/CpxP family protein refolding chaperone
MATLEEQFQEAEKIHAHRREAPPHAQARASLQKLDELHAQASTGDPDEREAAMKHYIQLVGELGQVDG